MIVLCSEACHAGLYPFNDRITQLYKFIGEQTGLPKNANISCENIFCGMGIPFIYKFCLREKNLDFENSSKTGKEIFDAGLNNQDEAATETVNLFVKILASSLQHIAAMMTPHSGIILSAGSILRNLKDLMLEDVSKGVDESQFLSTFLNNPAFKGFLETVPIYLCLQDELNLFGCRVTNICKFLPFSFSRCCIISKAHLRIS